METTRIHDSDKEFKHPRHAEQDTADANVEFVDRRDTEIHEWPRQSLGPRTGLMDGIWGGERGRNSIRLLDLQATRGNQYVQRLLNQSQRTWTHVTTQHAEPTTDAGHSPDSSVTVFSISLSLPNTQAMQTHDGPEGHEEFAHAEFGDEQNLSTPLAEWYEPQEGETIMLPDIVSPETAGLETTDAVAGSLTYEPSVRQGGIRLPADDFGFTGFYTPSVRSIAVTRTGSRYEVSATIENSIRWDVRADTGPDKQVNVESENSPNLTSTNYSDVVRDLTPNSLDLNGRPLRREFWARDLTARHEEFHANEYAEHGSQAAVLAGNWLAAQSAADVADVHLLLARVPGRIITTVASTMAFPNNERRAYGNGASYYQARADSIQHKGDNGDFA